MKLGSENHPMVVVADLKSPNVLLTERPQDTSGRIMCKVTDFGLSRDKEMDLQVCVIAPPFQLPMTEAVKFGIVKFGGLMVCGLCRRATRRR